MRIDQHSWEAAITAFEGKISHCEEIKYPLMRYVFLFPWWKGNYVDYLRFKFFKVQ